jgi:hypothetical protein
MDRVSDKISDSRVIGLIEKMLRQGVMETMNDWKPTEQGTPQGAVICFGPPHGPHPFGAACGWLPRPSVAHC